MSEWLNECLCEQNMKSNTWNANESVKYKSKTNLYIK